LIRIARVAKPENQSIAWLGAAASIEATPPLVSSAVLPKTMPFLKVEPLLTIDSATSTGLMPAGASRNHCRCGARWSSRSHCR
jgi:hypothetical protein